MRSDAKKKKTDCEVEEMNMKEEEDCGLIFTEERGCDCRGRGKQCRFLFLMSVHIPGVGGVTMEEGDQAGVVCRVTKMML